MLPKSKRLTTKIIASIMEKSPSFHTSFFVVRAVNTQETSRFSVSVPKKVAKTAVARNKIRRQVYSAIKSFKFPIKNGFNAVIIVKSGIELSFKELSLEIKNIFVKSGILK